MSEYELQWLLHGLHHLFHTAQYISHCRFIPARHLPKHPGIPGHSYYVGRFVCRVRAIWGNMYPA